MRKFVVFTLFTFLSVVLVVLSVVLVFFTRDVYAQVKVAAYYYPWYSNRFHYDQGYLREYLNQGPTLGEYDDRQSAVVEQHMEWSQQANIGVWITSWFGPRSLTDSTLISSILPAIEGSSLQFALFYESEDRIGITDPNLDRVVDDINYICDKYLNHPNYYHIGGRPVLFIYLARALQEEGVLARALLMMRTTGSKRGFHFYVVADHAFGPPPVGKAEYFSYFDAITNYDVYGQLAGPLYAGPERLSEYYRQQAQWKARAALQGCYFIPGITPGFNDRGVRIEVNHTPLSRKLTADADFGSFFKKSLEYAKSQVDPGADSLLVVTSFNEWHEDTQIEPAKGTLTTVPFNYTQGLEYDGYGTLYLDILYNMTTSGVTFRKPPPAPSRKPTSIPTEPPTPSPTRVPTPLPTPSPSSLPTLLHTHFPTQMPTINQTLDSVPMTRDWNPDSFFSCDDSRFGTFPTYTEGNKTCIWLAARPVEQLIYCQPSEPAYYVCEETCGRCKDNCFDSTGTFNYNGVERGCLWLSLRTFVQDIVCKPGSPAYDTVCPETCNACLPTLRHAPLPSPMPTPNLPLSSLIMTLDHSPDSCDDSRFGTFPTDTEGNKTCIWLAARPVEQLIYCQPSEPAYYVCEETCGRCKDNCFDSTGTFNYNGVERGCLWLSLRTFVQDIVCKPGSPAYDTICPETCNACLPTLRHAPLPSPMPTPNLPLSSLIMTLDHSPDSCDDSRFGTFPTYTEGNKTCIWLAARPVEQLIYCQPSEPAYYVCEETCGRCKDNCFDSTETFNYNGVERGCLWLSLRTFVQDIVCKPGSPAYDTICPETCNACDGRG